MHKILVLLESSKNQVSSVGLELVSEVNRQTENIDDVMVDALYLGEKLSDESLLDLHKVGVDTLYLMFDSKLKHYDTQIYSKNIMKFLEKNTYDVMLLGSTLMGRDLAPRISARIHTGLTADATILEFKNEDERLILEATRPALGGNIFATIICPNHIPQMATIRPNVFTIEYSEKKKCNVVILPLLDDTHSDVEIISVRENESDKVELSKATFIVAGGRGVESKYQDLLKISDYYDVEIAASRAVVDAKVTSKSRLVGQTGQTVKPKGYVALGISGAIQHVAGMDQSELVIAVNQDPCAPIFDVAHISLITDANAVIDELILLGSTHRS